MSFLTTRSARNASAAVVAGIAGYASYWHQVSVTLLAGERVELAHIMPLSVDGLLVVASVVMVDARREGRRPSHVTRFFFALGIAASVAANVASAHPTALGRAIASWPAIALLGVVEMLSRKGKLIGDEPRAVVPQVVVSAPAQAQHVIDQAAALLPVPVSPAVPQQRYHRSSSTAVPRRPAKSPLTGAPLG